ncbi:MAG: hypothetical protein Satyrvirus1_17 [Satyrvirus sp.]|uniref:RNase H type-1 domain-containing protein n=1 Tax=Satyrvirus sp. TaxID=2487771 RepID=A0A3G5AF81_9VIRU|nr:MAG: hypothetical protein Satyrvirus1_17 [Satyrvirus sp.]
MAAIKCYCDASYDPKSHVAIIGYIVGNNSICTEKIVNTNNTRAEIIGLINLIGTLEDNDYVIYTDCQNIIKRLKSKDKLVENGFKNKKGIPLSNADLYKKLFDTIKPNIKLEHIKGHLPTKFMTDDNKMFSMLDKFVRKKLRNIVTNSNNDS